MRKIFILLIFCASLAFAQENTIIRQDSLRASETATKSAAAMAAKGFINDSLNAAVRGFYLPVTDSSVFVKYSDSTSIWYNRSHINELLNSKQPVVPNISDTSKYLKKSDSTTFATQTNLSLKLNKSDSSIYATQTDISNKLDKSGGTLTGDLNTKALYSTTTTVSATTIDCSTSNNFTKSISNNTSFTISNMTDGQVINLVIINSGSYTVSWSTTIKWPSGVVPIVTISGTDIITLIKIGSTIYGTYVQDFQ